MLKVCWFLPLFIFNDIGMWWGNIFSPSWLQCLRYNSVCLFYLLLWRVCRALLIIVRLGESQLVAIEQLSKIFTKAAYDGKSTADPPQRQAEQTVSGIPQTLQPGRIKYIPPPQPNIIEDEEGKKPTNFQHKVHRSPSGTYIIPPDRAEFA